jgi:hypothetical protein
MFKFIKSVIKPKIIEPESPNYPEKSMDPNGKCFENDMFTKFYKWGFNEIEKYPSEDLFISFEQARSVLGKNYYGCTDSQLKDNLYLVYASRDELDPGQVRCHHQEDGFRLIYL